MAVAGLGKVGNAQPNFKAVGIEARTSREQVVHVSRSVHDSGHFDAVIDSEFALEDAGAAQQKMVTSNFFGKILLRP